MDKEHRLMKVTRTAGARRGCRGRLAAVDKTRELNKWEEDLDGRDEVF